MLIWWTVRVVSVPAHTAVRCDCETSLLTSSRLPPACLDRECVRGRLGGNRERLVLT